MIIIRTVKEFDEVYMREVEIVSHGIDSITLENIVLPQISLQNIGAKWDSEINEWILE